MKKLLGYLGITLLILCFGCSSKPSESTRLAGIHAPDDFSVELVAGPELLGYPMFATLDEQGRLFVFESTGNVYENTREALEDPQFRIKLLQDLDGDGIYDKATIFADKLSFPQGGVFYEGSLIASSAPDLLKLTDTDGDGVADEREVILSGWTLNVNANSLIGPFMGPDGWLYLTSAIEGFDVMSKEGERMKGETSRIWRVRPDGSDLQWVSAGGMNNPVELTFTNAGEVLGTLTFFVNPQRGLRDAINFYVNGGVYGKKNSNITRDKLPLTGNLMPPVSTYSRVAPSGIGTYRHNTLGEDFRDNMFSAQFNTHAIIRHKLSRKGASFEIRDEAFFWSDNEDFHPTDVLEDADGSLLVVETGGWFIKGCPLSQVSKPQLKGGIYRIRHNKSSKIQDPYGNDISWKSLAPDELIPYLSDSRPFVTDRAANQLIARGEEAVPVLSKVLNESDSENARIKAVFALYQISTIEALAVVRSGLKDKSLPVRIAAARSLGLARDSLSADLLMKMLKNDEPAARRQAATALGQIGLAWTVPGLLESLANTDDRFIRHAVMYAIISIGEPGPVVAGLRNSSPKVKEAALVILDQIPDSPLTASQVTPFLAAEDENLRRTALWVASHHQEWTGDMMEYLQTRLDDSGLKESEKQLLGEILVSYCGDSGMQDFLVRQLRNGKKEVKHFIMDNMGKCETEDVPRAWITQLGNELSASNDQSIQAKAVEIIRLRRISSLTKQLTKTADDLSNSADLRVACINVLLENSSVPADRYFPYLMELLHGNYEAPLQQRVASVLAGAKLSEPQLLQIASDFLPKADDFIANRLLPTFKGSSNVEVGKALAKHLLNSPVLDSFTEENLTNLFENYPSDIDEVRKQLTAKLEKLRNERLQKLTAIEAKIGDGREDRGSELYFGKAICSTCHAMGEKGGNLGPDLTSIQKDRSVHDIIEAIIYPSVSFVRDFETYQIKTKNTTYTGIIQEQTPQFIQLGTGAQTSVKISREEIQEISNLDVSLMPHGLEQLLTDGELADLIAFLLGNDLVY